MSRQWERYYPLVLSIPIAIIIIYILFFTNHVLIIDDNFSDILTATITFSTVVEGFLGVLLSIFISIKNTKIVKEIFSKVPKSDLMSYIKIALFFGFIVILISAILYLDINCAILNILFLLWAFCLSYYIWSSFRIIKIMFQIIETETTHPTASVLSFDDNDFTSSSTNEQHISD